MNQFTTEVDEKQSFSPEKEQIYEFPFENMELLCSQ